MDKKIVDYSDLMKLYRIQGRMKFGNFFATYKHFNGYAMVCNSQYAFDTIENKKRSPISSIVVEDNGNIHINATYEISSWKVGDINDYKRFNSFLDKKNFIFTLNYREREFGITPNKTIETIIEWALKYKDPNNVQFVCQNDIVSRKVIEDLKLEPGLSIISFYDNGYSYMSSDPISKEKFLEIVDEMILMPFKWSHRGIQVVELDNNFYIDCKIGKNEHWSEYSNS